MRVFNQYKTQLYHLQLLLLNWIRLNLTKRLELMLSSIFSLLELLTTSIISTMNATPAAKKNNMILAAAAAGGILGKRNKSPSCLNDKNDANRLLPY